MHSLFAKGGENVADYQKMYATVCAAASEAVDELENIPLAMQCRDRLKAALLKAEDIYIETTIHVTDTEETYKEALGRCHSLYVIMGLIPLFSSRGTGPGPE